MVKKILVILLIVLIGIQFIRPAKNSGNATTSTDVTHYVQVPDTIMHMLKRSCYDCHSNHTDYPWYVNINPIGLWMRGHINDGKEELNFSDFSKYDKRRMDHKLGAIADQVKKGEMPLTSYTLIHTYAKLNKDQINLISQWVDTARKEVGYKK